MDKQKIIENIYKIKDISRLAILAAGFQLDYWYDPCGKSGFEFNETTLHPATKAALKRIIELKKLDGRF